MWDGGGNVPPELAVARRLVGRGHAVRVLGDQNDTAARVVHSGAGVRLKPTASVNDIWREVKRTLQTPSCREAATAIAQAIATRKGCADAVERLESLAGNKAATIPLMTAAGVR